MCKTAVFFAVKPAVSAAEKKIACKSGVLTS
jgi:hypothetical protein